MSKEVAYAVYAALGGPLALGFDAEGQPWLGLVTYRNGTFHITPCAQLQLLGDAVDE